MEELIGDGVAVVTGALVGGHEVGEINLAAVGASVRGGRTRLNGDAAGAVAVGAGHVSARR